MYLQRSRKVTASKCTVHFRLIFRGGIQVHNNCGTVAVLFLSVNKGSDIWRTLSSNEMRVFIKNIHGTSSTVED
jgi:hypothetical protein